jgi:hypothetical protein
LRADPDDDLPDRLMRLITRLIRDAAELVAEHSMGEIPALLQRCHKALTAIAAEAEEREYRRCRYRRQGAVLNLLILVDGVARYRTESQVKKDGH